MYKLEIENLRNKQARVCVLHYSCENLGDNNQALSPRITSIAVQDFSSRMMHSFSIHLIAEKRGVSRDQIESQYDDLEREMLKDFNDFLKKREKKDSIWLHWNMSNINFGFEAIEHRFNVLNKKPFANIEDSKRKNLSSLITWKYGNNCVDHPRMETLMNLNGGIPRDYLSGPQEVEAFKNKEYLKLHKSTMTKVYWFTEMFSLLLQSKIKTQRANWREKCSSILESNTAKVIGLIASAAGLAQLGYIFYCWFVKQLN